MSSSMELVISTLLENGWVENGRTVSEQVRIPTSRSPIFGKCGGELATFGGRLRFVKGNRKCTVGKRTTYFYDSDNPEGGKPFNTKDFDEITSECKK